MKYTLRGGCMCGSIRYRVSSGPAGVCTCHCVSCRKATGSTNVTWALFSKSDFRFESRSPSTYSSSPSVKRTFCATCGTALTYEHDRFPDRIDVTVASLENPEHFAPTEEVWLSDALSWEPVNPDISHHLQDSP